MKKTLILLLILTFNQRIFGSTYGVVTASNCYQKISGSLTSTTNFNFLNTSDGRNIIISSDNPLDISNVDMFYKDAAGNWIPFYYGLNLGTPIVINPSYQSIKINPNNNPYSLGSTAQPVIINFVDPTINPTSSTPCIKKNSSNFRLNLNLDGLCSPPKYKITVHPTSPQRGGIPLNWSLEQYDLPNNSLNVPFSDEFCSQTNWLDEYGHVVSPQLTFNVEITLEPCVGSNCPEYKFNTTMVIACDCGYFNPNQN